MKVHSTDTHAPDGDGNSKSLELSIVMPCLNEAETLGRCIRKAQAFIVRNGLSAEVIVADNGSADGSQRIAYELGARVITVRDKGYGSALVGGIAAADGVFVIMGDADDSYDFSSLEPIMEALHAGAELVMGNRFRGGIEPGAMPPLHRFLGNPVLTAVGRLFFRSPVRDFHCGLRGFRKSSIERLDLQTTGMEFASEMVVKASLLRLRISEVPVKLHRDGRSRPAHLRTWRDGWRHLRFLLLYSPRWLFLYPGLALMTVGLMVGGALLPGPRYAFGVGFDVHTLVYAAIAVLVGSQAVAFAVFTKAFGINARLLPEDDRFSRYFRLINLEAGLGCGALLLLLGIAGTIAAVGEWGQRGFGSLNPSETLRIIIPATLAVVLGCEVVLFSFLISVLSLRRRGWND